MGQSLLLQTARLAELQRGRQLSTFFRWLAHFKSGRNISMISATKIRLFLLGIILWIVAVTIFSYWRKERAHELYNSERPSSNFQRK